ncbi:MAG TPA: acetylglutamate kinase [Candidatus Limnocylindria bacterium]|nr:acetylglutamate kinase [Candidatus Limnocylindria bacterium]
MSGTARGREALGDRVVVIKVGGAAAGDEGIALDLVAERVERPEAFVIVHGGGPLVGEWSKRLGLETRFQDGLRITDATTRDVALAALAGLANKRLVAALAARGVNAVGVSGVDAGLLVVDRAEPTLGFVGRVRAVRPKLIETLLEGRFVPVIAPAARDAGGELVNVNADEAAGAIAAGTGARLLLFVTDVDGVRDRGGRLISRLDAAEVERLRSEGVVSGGMLPKLEACLVAAAEGCTAAIVRATDRDAIRAVLEGHEAGTVVAA